MAARTALHLLSDGVIKVDGGVVFGQTPKSQWQDWTPPDRRNRVRIGLNCLLVQAGGKNYLVDTGVGQKLSAEMRQAFGVGASQLLPALHKLGCPPQEIHGVILTSLHFKHTGNCTKMERRFGVVPTFPRARYYVQRAAFEEAMSPNERDPDGFIKDDYMPLYEKGLLELVEDEAMLAPGIQVRRTGGPSKGHQVVMVNHGGERVAVLGDLVPTKHHLRYACIASSDRQPEETLEAKKQMLSEAVDEGWLLVFSHDAEERAGYLERRNGRHYLRPVEFS